MEDEEPIKGGCNRTAEDIEGYVWPVVAVLGFVGRWTIAAGLLLCSVMIAMGGCAKTLQNKLNGQ
jgi:hypothetical protein